MASPARSFPVKRSSTMTALFVHLLLVVSVALAVAACGEARMSDGSSMSENPRPFQQVQMSVASHRRVLATTNNTTMNATTSLSEDADVLFLLKAAITSDPLNVTRYWKPIGRRQRINPCKPWRGITCTRRRVTAINLFNESLAGTLPASLSRLSNLITLNLSTNAFSGPVPSNLPSTLQFLDLGNNHLSGSFFSSQPSFPNLTSLILSNNALTGTIPTAIANLTSLQTLNLSGNSFTGQLPAAFSAGLELLDLSDNNLTGSIPNLSRLRNLTVLDLGSNNLHGGVPATVGNCTRLVTLDLSRNPLLGGEIPAHLGNLKNLKSLQMAGSNLNGTIPQAMNSFLVVAQIDLSDNRLSGDIPFANLGNLTVLHLQNNRLEGDFVSRVSGFPVLASLDLRNNLLSGSVPDAIGGVQLRSGLWLGGNQLSGRIPDGLGQLTLVQQIDLSANRFTGSIPDAIRTCLSLTQLNVSYNNLNGTLPSLINLASLKSVDASNNGFTGGVASTFVDFTALQFLNVSSNHLSGELPHITAHDDVTARSFLNNTGLCGTLAGRKCSSSKLATSTIIYIAIGSAAGLVALLVLAFVLVSYCKGWKGKGSKHSAQISAELQLKVTPEEILAATNQFNETGYIGGGKLSTVYRGVLPDQTAVAVKRLAVVSSESENAEARKALDAELEFLGHVRHKSLVKVLGYCSSADTKALVLEYMPHGSLDSFLHPPENEEVHLAFDFTVRLKIALEMAEGLKWLHSESRHPVVHGDVKPSNILFDANMEARIADFGVARVLREQGLIPTTSTSSSAATANCYTAPEVAESGTQTMKGDVYSFGIILLEMITGRSPYTLSPGQTLPQWVRATMSNFKALHNVLDAQLMPELATHQQKMAMVLGVALLCTRHQAQERPEMEDVHKMLAHIRNKSSDSTRRRGIMSSTRRRSLHSSSRSTSEPQPPPPLPTPSPPLLPHTPSLSDWTPPNIV